MTDYGLLPEQIVLFSSSSNNNDDSNGANNYSPLSQSLPLSSPNLTTITSSPIPAGAGSPICNATFNKQYTDMQFFIYGWALPIVALLGILVNTLNIVVLTDRRLFAPTYKYLAFLAAADATTLLLYFIELIGRLHFKGQFWTEVFRAYIYLPIGSITNTSSLLLTVAFTVDRFIYIRKPTSVSSQGGLLLVLEKYQLRAKIGCICIFLASALINCPRMASWYVDFSTSCQRYRPWASEAGGGWFAVYSYVRMVVLNIGSIVTMAIFNILLIVLVHRSSARAQQRRSIGSASTYTTANRALTMTLIGATLLALVGEIPSTLFSRISAIVLWRRSMDVEPFRSLILVAYSLQFLEKSGNFFIYFLLNSNFRKVLQQKLCMCCVICDTGSATSTPTATAVAARLSALDEAKLRDEMLDIANDNRRQSTLDLLIARASATTMATTMGAATTAATVEILPGPGITTAADSMTTAPTVTPSPSRPPPLLKPFKSYSVPPPIRVEYFV